MHELELFHLYVLFPYFFSPGCWMIMTGFSLRALFGVRKVEGLVMYICMSGCMALVGPMLLNTGAFPPPIPRKTANQPTHSPLFIR